MSNTHQGADSLRRAALQQLESLQRAGVKQIAKAQHVAAPVQAPVAPSAGSPVVARLPNSPPSPRTTPLSEMPLIDVAERPAALEVIDREVKGCTLCAELVKNRTQTVFGVGHIAPRVCFFGEAPGADEDKQGEPFVGRAGKLLNDIIKACTFQREDVYILNVCKCRPPGNRTPLPEEAANCRHFWERQLEILRPGYVVCLGACAAQNMLQTTQSIGRLRGRFHDYRGVKVVATYHPAYLLRNPEAKRDVWNDMQMLMRDMGIPIPGKSV